MPLKPRDSVNNLQNRQVDFNLDAFIQGVLNNDYILVVGSGVMMNREKYPDTNGDINTFLLNAINSNRNTCDQFKSLSHAVTGTPHEISPLYTIITTGIDYVIDDIAPELRKLLEKKVFRFVFTTTPDHYLETLLSKIWDNDLRVVNFSDSNSMRSFRKSLKSTSNYNQPTLFYVFGKAINGQFNPTKFLETDDDAIAFIQKWIKIDDSNLISFLRSKRIFSIGCNFDDWYHRFFWRILTSDFSRNGELYNDNAVLSGRNGQLQEYLGFHDVCVHENPWGLLLNITEALTKAYSARKYKDFLQKIAWEGRIFLSYKNKPDKIAASAIYQELSQRTTFNIWFDDPKTLGGQHYNERIPGAISYSKIFMPILTEAVAEILSQYTSEELDEMDLKSGLPFFIHEWKLARQVAGITIIPIAFDGYDLREPYHQKFEAVIFNNASKKASGINVGTPENLNPAAIGKLTESIRYALGIQ
jgi:hypothetical protein